MMLRNRRIRSIAVAIGVAVVMVAAGCGSSDSPELAELPGVRPTEAPGDSETPTEPTPTAVPDDEPAIVLDTPDDNAETASRGQRSTSGGAQTDEAAVGEPDVDATDEAAPEPRSGECTPIDTNATSVWFLPNWQTGESWEYAVESQRTGDNTQPRELTGTSRLDVLERSSDGLRFTWTRNAPRRFDLPSDDAYFENLPPQGFDYRLDADRYLTGLGDTEAVRSMMTELGTYIADADPILEAPGDLYYTMTDEELASTVTTEPELLHTFEGFQIEIGEVLNYEVDGDQVSMAITDVIDDGGCLVVEMETRGDFGDFGDFFSDVAEEAGVARGNANIFFTERVVGRYDVGAAMFRSIERTSTTEFSGSQPDSDVSVFVIELQPS